jgi:adenosine deaminase
LTHQQIVSAVLKGLERGRKDFGVTSGLIICAMRNMSTSLEMAELAVDFRVRGVVGFDLAGEEGGYPPKKHVEALHYIQRENFNITIRPGEGCGKESIWQGDSVLRSAPHRARNAIDRGYRCGRRQGSQAG